MLTRFHLSSSTVQESVLNAACVTFLELQPSRYDLKKPLKVVIYRSSCWSLLHSYKECLFSVRDVKLGKESDDGKNDDFAARLWDLSEKYTGLKTGDEPKPEEQTQETTTEQGDGTREEINAKVATPAEGQTPNQINEEAQQSKEEAKPE